MSPLYERAVNFVIGAMTGGCLFFAVAYCVDAWRENHRKK